jgi:CheY-like chemotaxis protein
MKTVDTICVIDDNDVYQFVMKNSINKLNPNIKILAYLNGQEGIDSLKEMIENKEPLPDVILLDINMPIMDGWEFMNEFIKIKSKLPRVMPIYLTTSSLDASDIDKAKTYEDITGFLSKPIDRHTLLKITQSPS